MNKCVICNKEIKNDSQFIKGKWYHNDCIESLNNIIDKLEKYLVEEIKSFEEDGYDKEEKRKRSLWLAGCYDQDKRVLERLKELKNK